MKFKVIKTKEAQKDFKDLTKDQQEILESDYTIISSKGIEFVKTRYLDTGLFEIKTNELRSIFRYEENQIILIGVIFVKDSQKTPKDIIKRAKKILEV